MNIATHFGIDCDTKYTINEFNNLFSKYTDLDMSKFYITNDFLRLLINYKNAHMMIKFIDVFEDVNKFETYDRISNKYSLAGNMMLAITHMEYDTNIVTNNICVYKIMDHLLKRNMDVTAICVNNKTSLNIHGIEVIRKRNYDDQNNYDMIQYIINNWDIIQCVRKLINNNDILLFNITDDLPFIELLLLITRCKRKNLPKFIIIHKILYYYLQDKNENYNI